MIETALAIWGTITIVASTITKLTKTTKDDEILAKVIKFVDNFSVFNPKENQHIIDVVKDNARISKEIEDENPYVVEHPSGESL